VTIKTYLIKEIRPKVYGIPVRYATRSTHFIRHVICMRWRASVGRAIGSAVSTLTLCVLIPLLHLRILKKQRMKMWTGFI